MNFATLKGLSIPEGVVTKISRENGTLIWTATTARIPPEYQEVEYLFANKNVQAYIDLGFAYSSGATIEIGQYIYDNDTVYLFGAAENSGKLRCMLSSPYSDAVTIYGSKGDAFISIGLTYKVNALNNMKSIFKPGDWAGYNYSNGSTAGPTTALKDYTMTNNLYLFAQNYNGSPRYGGIRRIHYFRYYDKNDELVCNLIPCYRKSDNISGMYDITRKIFLTNVLNNGIIFGIGPAVGNNSDQSTYTNLIHSAVGDDGELYGGFGYKDGMRWSSSGNKESEYGTARLSGWMPYIQGSTYRYKNFYMKNGYVNGSYVIYKRADGTTFTETVYLSRQDNYEVNTLTDTCTFYARHTDVVSFRISGYSGAYLPIVTKNEEIPIE